MKLIFASHNAHKASEIQSILPSWIEIKTLSDLQYLDEIPENEATIEGNSQFKARFVHEKFEQNCFADDTGLEIFTLNGRPGVHSARYAGEQRDSEDNMNKVLMELETLSDRSPDRRLPRRTATPRFRTAFVGYAVSRICPLRCKP